MRASRRVVITGGPGVGKTTLLEELGARGYTTVAESARAIIAERRAQGLSPRPAPAAFAREILRRDTEKYRANPGDAAWVFFDRGAVEALGMLHEAEPMAASELDRALGTHRFHSPVFILPPWPTIYTTDAERDHSLGWVEHVHDRLVRWYRACGYELCEVPRLPVAARVDFVLETLASDPMPSSLDQLSPETQSFWGRFVAHLGHDPAQRFFEAFHFDDNQPSADELAELVLRGTKRATAALLWSYEAERKPLPEAGSLSIVTRWSGAPVCVIETTAVELVPFQDVSAEFAAIEGEGDGSLAFWQRVHTAFFGRECVRLGKVFDAQALVVCEQFKVVFPLHHGSG